MEVRLLHISNPTVATYKMVGQTGTLNITNGTFCFIAEGGTFVSGRLTGKAFSGDRVTLVDHNGVTYEFEIK